MTNKVRNNVKSWESLLKLDLFRAIALIMFHVSRIDLKGSEVLKVAEEPHNVNISNVCSHLDILVW